MTQCPSLRIHYYKLEHAGIRNLESNLEESNWLMMARPPEAYHFESVGVHAEDKYFERKMGAKGVAAGVGEGWLSMPSNTVQPLDWSYKQLAHCLRGMHLTLLAEELLLHAAAFRSPQT
jgi:hypothetical protein